jgi:hypothetical protein
MTFSKLSLLTRSCAAVTAAAAGLYALTQAYQADVIVRYAANEGGIYKFSLEATGASPVVVYGEELRRGGIITTAIKDVTVNDRSELDKISSARVIGPFMSGAMNEINLFPGEKYEFPIGLTHDSTFFKVSAFTLGLKYKYKYENNNLDKAMTLSEIVGIGRKSQREACFFVCGASVAKISCGYTDADTYKSYRSFCEGEFKNDKACCGG